MQVEIELDEGLIHASIILLLVVKDQNEIFVDYHYN